MSVLKIVDDAWYKDGLAFSCTGCGACCTGAPGFVWLDSQEVLSMAAHLNLSEKEFIQTYCRAIDGRLSLKERPGNYDCIFLKGKACTVYEVRPTQCRTFPWWPQNLRSKESWQLVAGGCEGMRVQEPVVDKAHIDEQLALQEQANLRR